MATEVTVKVLDKRFFKQALFVRARDWDLSLADLRTLFIDQELNLPHEYKFVTASGNVVSKGLEGTITLKEIVKNKNTSASPKETVEVKSEDIASEEIPQNQNTLLQICLLPQDASASSDNESDSDSPEMAETHMNRDQFASSGNHNCRRNHQRTCHGCPVLMLKNMFPSLYSHISPKRLMKLIFVLIVILTCLTAALTLTVHMMMTVVGCLSTHGGLADMFMNMPQSEPTAVTQLQVRLSELEMSTKFEVQDLKRKLAELEDLYLRDLDTQRKELATLKAKQADVEKVYSQDVDNLNTKLDMLTSMVGQLQGVGANQAESVPGKPNNKEKEKKKDGKAGKGEGHKKERGDGPQMDEFA